SMLTSTGGIGTLRISSVERCLRPRSSRAPAIVRPDLPSARVRGRQIEPTSARLRQNTVMTPQGDSLGRPEPGMVAQRRGGDIVAAQHSASVAAVITDDHGHVLLIQAATISTGNPRAGSSNSAETVEDGLRRETREETGLDIEPITLTGVYKNMPRGIIALVFHCKPTGGAPAPTEEGAGVRRG